MSQKSGVAGRFRGHDGRAPDDGPTPDRLLAATRSLVWALVVAVVSIGSTAAGQDQPPADAPKPPGAATASRLRVRVSDAEGDPVKGATVQLFDGAREIASLTTGEDGTAELESAPRRELRIAAKAAGRHPADATLDAEAAPRVRGSSRDLPGTNGTAFATRIARERDRSGAEIARIVLQPLRTIRVTGAPASSRVVGRVVATEFAIRNLEGVTVREVSSGTERLLATLERRADDEGNAEFDGVPSGATIVVRAESDDRYVPAIEVEVDDDETARLTSSVPALTISGCVRDSAGKPVAGALVHAAPSDFPEALADTTRPPESRTSDAEHVPLGWTVTSDAAGAFAFRSLDPAATHAIRATAGAGALASAVTWDIAAPPDARASTADVVVVPVVSLDGALASEGEPVVAEGVAALRAVPRDDGVERTCRLSGGKFRFDGIVPGRWLIAARGDGFLSSEREIEVPSVPGDPVRIEVDLGAVIAGRVVDPAGAPVAGAAVHAFDPASEAVQVIRYPFGAQRAVSGPDGTFRITGLDAGEWNVRVLADEGLATEVVRAEAPAKDVVVRTGPCPKLRFSIKLPEGVGLRDIRLGVFRLVGDGTPYQAGEFDRAACTETVAAFRGLPADEDVIVRFVVPPHPPFMRSLRLLPGEDRDLGELVPPEPQVLEGIVVDSKGEPLDGVDVRAELSEEDATTGADGKFRLVAVAAGSQRVTCSRFGRDGSMSGESVIVVPSATPATIVALRSAHVTGSVVRDDGSAVRGVVTFSAVRPWGRLRRPKRCEMDERGEFEQTLEPGRWVVRVDGATDSESLVREVTIEEEQAKPLRLVVPAR